MVQSSKDLQYYYNYSWAKEPLMFSLLHTSTVLPKQLQSWKIKPLSYVFNIEIIIKIQQTYSMIIYIWIYNNFHHWPSWFHKLCDYFLKSNLIQLIVFTDYSNLIVIFWFFTEWHLKIVLIYIRTTVKTFSIAFDP